MLGGYLVRFGLQVNQAKTKTVLLAHLSPLHKYTFLSIPNQHLGSSLEPLTQTLQSSPLNAFVSAARHNLHILDCLREVNYGHNDLLKLDNDQPLSLQALNKHRQILKTTAELYSSLISSIK